MSVARNGSQCLAVGSQWHAVESQWLCGSQLLAVGSQLFAVVSQLLEAKMTKDREPFYNGYAGVYLPGDKRTCKEITFIRHIVPFM